jgi:hypothetical protein
MNSKRTVQGAILVGTNRMTKVRNISVIIRGKDGRVRMPLIQIRQ